VRDTYSEDVDNTPEDGEDGSSNDKVVRPFALDELISVEQVNNGGHIDGKVDGKGSDFSWYFDDIGHDEIFLFSLI